MSKVLKSKDELENIKVKRLLLEKVRKIKKHTGISIIAFVEKAITKEIELYKKEEIKTT